MAANKRTEQAYLILNGRTFLIGRPIIVLVIGDQESKKPLQYGIGEFVNEIQSHSPSSVLFVS